MAAVEHIREVIASSFARLVDETCDANGWALVPASRSADTIGHEEFVRCYILRCDADPARTQRSWNVTAQVSCFAKTGTNVNLWKAVRMADALAAVLSHADVTLRDSQADDPDATVGFLRLGRADATSLPIADAENERFDQAVLTIEGIAQRTE